MPSRKLTDRCPRCHSKNHLRAMHCNQCGAKLDEERATRDTDGRAKLYADIAHPINCDCREMIQKKVIAAYDEEVVRSKQPGYVCTYDDYGEERYATLLDADEEAALCESLAAENGRMKTVAREGNTYRSSRDDRTHRIDPPVLNPVPQSHVPPEGVDVPVYANRYLQTASTEDDDGFGAGIV